MSLFDIYKARQLSNNTESLMDTFIGKKLGASGAYNKVDLATLNWESRYTGTTNKTILAHLPTKYPQKRERYFKSKYTYNGYVTATTDLSNPDEKTAGLYCYFNGLTTEYNDIIYLVIPKSETPSGNLTYEIDTPAS
jgi:hypothetical protein